MKIDFILSDTTKNATTIAIEEIVKVSENDLFQNNIVIVPETKSIIIEKELLNLSKNGAFGNVFVYSFVRLLERLNAVSKEKIVSKQALIILIRKIIYENIDKLVCYKKTAKSVGFAEKIYETIAQLKSSGVSPEDLRLTLQTKSEALKSKLEDILFLYEKYEESLSGELYDDCDKLALISDFSKKSQFLKESNVYVVGFDNITFEMQEVLKSVAINCKSITFSAVYFSAERLNKHIQPNELYNKFKYIADSLNYPYVPKRQNIRQIHDLEVIKSYLFATKKVKAKSKGNIEIFQASSEKFEIDYVANTILAEVKNGKRFKDIGVFVNGLEDRLEQIQDCFNAYKIPYFANVAQKIDNHFLVRFISNAFELVKSNLKSETVLEFVSNPLFGAKNYAYFESYVNEVGTNYNEFLEDIDENFIKRETSGIKNIVKLEDEELIDFDEVDEVLDSNKIDIDSKLATQRKSNLSDLKSDLKMLKDFYLKFSDLMRNSNTAREYIDAIDFVLKTFDIQKRLIKLSEFQKENGLIVQGEISAVILSKLELFNKQIINFLGENLMPTNEFIQIYKSGFLSCKINISPVSIDCVIIQENTDGFYNIKDMFIVGGVEGNFPSKLQDSGIILDSELKEAKQKMGKVIEPSVKDINRREKFRSYESLLEPKEKLYISYSEKKRDGKILRPCQIIIDLIGIFGDGILKTTYERLDFVNFDIYENYFAGKVNKYLNGEINFDEVNKIKNILGTNISKNLDNYLKSLAFGNYNFVLDGISELYFTNDKTSISQIQKYFACPYNFFASYGLRLKENKIARITASDIGTIIHRVAELFLIKYEKVKDLKNEELIEEIHCLISIAMEENYFSAEKNKSLFGLLTTECERLCKYILFEQNNSNFKFKKAEYNFDGKNSIKLNNKSNRKIKITGKIDRIDKFGDFVRVIDYKTGKFEKDLKSIYYGKKIQLATYISAISNDKTNKVAGILYLPILSSYKSQEEGEKLYKMQGFLLDDVEVVKYMDSTLSPEKKASNFVPLSVTFDKKTGEMKINHQIRSFYSENDFNAMENYVNNLCAIAVDEILSGYIEPSPYIDSNSDMNKPSACAYCELFGFCNLSKAKYKYGRKLNKSVEIQNFYLDNGGTDD